MMIDDALGEGSHCTAPADKLSSGETQESYIADSGCPVDG